MISLLLKILMVLSGMVMYIKGETYTKWLGKSNKNWKYAMGIPISLLGALAFQSWIPLVCALTYFIGAEFGYGESNLLRKWLGKRGAITFCGAALGLASAPILSYWSIAQAIIGGIGFYLIAVFDDKDIIKEPYVAILRGACALCLIPLF